MKLVVKHMQQIIKSMQVLHSQMDRAQNQQLKGWDVSKEV